MWSSGSLIFLGMRYDLDWLSRTYFTIISRYCKGFNPANYILSYLLYCCLPLIKNTKCHDLKTFWQGINNQDPPMTELQDFRLAPRFPKNSRRQLRRLWHVWIICLKGTHGFSTSVLVYPPVPIERSTGKWWYKWCNYNTVYDGNIAQQKKKKKRKRGKMNKK